MIIINYWKKMNWRNKYDKDYLIGAVMKQNNFIQPLLE